MGAYYASQIAFHVPAFTHVRNVQSTLNGMAAHVPYSAPPVCMMEVLPACPAHPPVLVVTVSIYVIVAWMGWFSMQAPVDKNAQMAHTTMIGIVMHVWHHAYTVQVKQSVALVDQGKFCF